MKSQNEKSTQQLINEYIALGGVKTICKPKIAPKHRHSKRKVLTRDQMKSAIGQRPLSQILKLAAV